MYKVNEATKEFELFDHLKDEFVNHEPLYTFSTGFDIASKSKATKSAKKIAVDRGLAFNPSSDIVSIKSITGPDQECLLCREVTHRGFRQKVCDECVGVYRFAKGSATGNKRHISKSHLLERYKGPGFGNESEEFAELLARVARSKILRRDASGDHEDSVSSNEYGRRVAYSIYLADDQHKAMQELVDLVNELLRKQYNYGFRSGNNLLMRIASDLEDVLSEIKANDADVGIICLVGRMGGIEKYIQPK